MKLVSPLGHVVSEPYKSEYLKQGLFAEIWANSWGAPGAIMGTHTLFPS